MKQELSYSRAIWHKDEYIGTAEPCASIKAKCTHNMDVDYWFTRKHDDYVKALDESIEPVNMHEWLKEMVTEGHFVETESLEHSRDMRDVWYFGPPSWVSADMLQETRI